MMATLNFLANPGSVHVRQWIDLGSHSGQIDVYCIGEDATILQDFENIRVVAPLPSWAKRLPKPVRYFLLGLWVRIWGPKGARFHAHNSSGYGLAAAVTGRPYVLTTYGSEIFQSEKNGQIYKAIVKFALKKAVAITTTSQKMATVIQQDFGVAPEKIVTFSLGVPDPFFKAVAQTPNYTRKGYIWFNNRRILPLYKTLEVVSAFKSFKASDGVGRLILLRGDASGCYYESVYREVKEHPDITLITDYLDERKMIELLDQSDFTISIPETDQLSSAILEGLARGKVPILRPIDSYSPISECGVFIDHEKPDTEALLEAFQKTSSFSGPEMKKFADLCKSLAQRQYSKHHAVEKYRQILKLHFLSNE